MFHERMIAYRANEETNESNICVTNIFQPKDSSAIHLMHKTSIRITNMLTFILSEIYGYNCFWLFTLLIPRKDVDLMKIKHLNIEHRECVHNAP